MNDDARDNGAEVSARPCVYRELCAGHMEDDRS